MLSSWMLIESCQRTLLESLSRNFVSGLDNSLGDVVYGCDWSVEISIRVVLRCLSIN